MGGCTHAARCSPERDWGCAWWPSQLAEAVRTIAATNGGGVNEFIVSRSHWEASLPHVVEAVLCVGRQCEERGRSLHAAFREAYGDEAIATPLVRYNRSTRARRAFEEMT